MRASRLDLLFSIQLISLISDFIRWTFNRWIMCRNDKSYLYDDVHRTILDHTDEPPSISSYFRISITPTVPQRFDWISMSLCAYIAPEISVYIRKFVHVSHSGFKLLTWFIRTAPKATNWRNLHTPGELELAHRLPLMLLPREPHSWARVLSGNHAVLIDTELADLIARAELSDDSRCSSW